MVDIVGCSVVGARVVSDVVLIVGVVARESLVVLCVINVVVVGVLKFGSSVVSIMSLVCGVEPAFVVVCDVVV